MDTAAVDFGQPVPNFSHSVEGAIHLAESGRRRVQPLNRSELERLYRMYGPMVHRRARLILRNDSEAEDAMQDVFVKVVRHYSRFREESSPATWLYRITTNVCLNRIRDARLRREKTETISVEMSIAIDPSTRIDMLRVIHRLPTKITEPAVYAFVDGMSQDEIAALLEVPRRTIGRRIETFVKEAKRILATSEGQARG
jgi:RNA polymerase sigma-70 factor, ECF subfamily